MRFTTTLMLVAILFLPGCSESDGEAPAPLVQQKPIVPDPAANPKADQHGEAIIPAANAREKTPLRRHIHCPWFQLSNLRLVDGANGPGDQAIAFDFERTEGNHPGFNELRLAGRNHAGPVRILLDDTAFGLGESGTYQLRISSMFAPVIGAPPDRNFELWLEMTDTRAGEAKVFKVSNSLFSGNTGREVTAAREWTLLEEREISNWVRTGSPRPPIPTGYSGIGPGTELVLGVQVLVNQDAEWKRGELIQRDKASRRDTVRGTQSYIVKFAHDGKLSPCAKSDLMIDEATRRDLIANPGRFRPSVRTLPGGTEPIPDGMQVVDQNTPLPLGTPLKAQLRGRGPWLDVTVVELPTKSTVKLKWGGRGALPDEVAHRDVLLISEEALAAAKAAAKDVVFAPGAVAKKDEPAAEKMDEPEENAKKKEDEPDGHVEDARVAAARERRARALRLPGDEMEKINNRLRVVPEEDGEPVERAPAADANTVNWAIRVLKRGDTTSRDAEEALNFFVESEIEPARLEEAGEAIASFAASNTSWFVGDSLIRAAAQVRTPQTERMLIAKLSERFGSWKKEAILLALGKHKTESAARAAAGFMTDPYIAVHASTALRDIGPPAEPVVIDLTKSRHVSMRLEAYDILRVIGTKKGLARLKGLITSEKDSNGLRGVRTAIAAIEKRLAEGADQPPVGDSKATDSKATGAKPADAKKRESATK